MQLNEILAILGNAFSDLTWYDWTCLGGYGIGLIFALKYDSWMKVRIA